MTNPYRAMCAELIDALDSGIPAGRIRMSPLADRARALLAQAVAEGVLPLKERPDFIAGYREGLADRRRIIECEEAERPAAQPVAEEPTDDEIEEWADACSEAPLEEMDPEVHGWRRCFTAKEFSETIRAALDRWGRPTPQPEGGDIHYSWELHDAEGEWQAGGSAITLESVRREGNHYLQTYSQDGPHTLIIYQASTIEVVTND